MAWLSFHPWRPVREGAVPPLLPPIVAGAVARDSAASLRGRCCAYLELILRSFPDRFVDEELSNIEAALVKALSDASSDVRTATISRMISPMTSSTTSSCSPPACAPHHRRTHRTGRARARTAFGSVPLLLARAVRPGCGRGAPSCQLRRALMRAWQRVRVHVCARAWTCGWVWVHGW